MSLSCLNLFCFFQEFPSFLVFFFWYANVFAFLFIYFLFVVVFFFMCVAANPFACTRLNFSGFYIALWRGRASMHACACLYAYKSMGGFRLAFKYLIRCAT